MIFNLDPSDINVIMQHLEQGQFRTVAPVLMKIQSQVVTQQVAPTDTPPDAENSAGGTD